MISPDRHMFLTCNRSVPGKLENISERWIPFPLNSRSDLSDRDPSESGLSIQILNQNLCIQLDTSKWVS